MSIGRTVRRTVRSILERRGYWIRHQSVLPYGVEYQHDIRRLSNIFGTSVNVFFDVGANSGQTSAAALTSFPDATVYAFEPDKATFTALTANIRSSRFCPFNLALSDRCGEARFFDYGALATSNSLVEDSQYASRSNHQATIRSVDCDTLDGLCRKLGVDQIDVLKVDTEGHDLAVLRGAERMLAERRILNGSASARCEQRVRSTSRINLPL